MIPTRRALIVVDVQQEYFQGPLEIQYPDRFQSLANITRALDIADEQSIPVAVVQHELPEGAPVFAVGTDGWKLHPEVESRIRTSWKRVTKSFGSIFAGTDVEEWLREKSVDTITVIGYMTNNCDLATAAAAEPLGFSVEVLSDASGAINLANEAGAVSAQQLHETLMAVLHSNFAAVATTGEWERALRSGEPLSRSNLVASAMQARAVLPTA